MSTQVFITLRTVITIYELYPVTSDTVLFTTRTLSELATINNANAPNICIFVYYFCAQTWKGTDGIYHILRHTDRHTHMYIWSYTCNIGL